jgi:TRAP-type C4-dicarboxylate transport system substrate-binding protein
VKTVLQDVAVDYRDHIANIAMDRAAESLEAYVAAGGKIIEVSAEERAAWANAMPNLAAEWAANLDKRGEAGTEMLNAYIGKLKDAGFVGVRDWTVK